MIRIPYFVLKMSETIMNKGKGAGGANTNKNGLPYEEMTDYKIVTR